MVLDIKGNFDVQILKRDLSLIGRYIHIIYYITIMSPHHCWICFEEGVVATDDITNGGIVAAGLVLGGKRIMKAGSH